MAVVCDENTMPVHWPQRPEVSHVSRRYEAAMAAIDQRHIAAEFECTRENEVGEGKQCVTLDKLEGTRKCHTQKPDSKTNAIPVLHDPVETYSTQPRRKTECVPGRL